MPGIVLYFMVLFIGKSASESFQKVKAPSIILDGAYSSGRIGEGRQCADK